MMSTVSIAARQTPRLTTRLWLPLLILVGIVVYFPALRSPFLLDDYLHASMIDGTFPSPRGPFELYDFVNDADRPLLIERGMLPWWSHPELKIRFLRPLPSAIRWADHRLLGGWLLPLHLHSLAWWLAAVLAARALFRRSFTPRVAWLATGIFAIAPCHVLPLAWLANREALISLTLGFLALGAQLRWRDEGRLRHALLAAALFSLTMLGGEYAICFGGYVLARELVQRGDRLLPHRAGTWQAGHLLGVLPFVVPAAAYVSVREALDYGTAGSGFYTDPFQAPLAFLASAPRRLATLLANAWLSLDSETLDSKTPWWALALFVVVMIALLRTPIARAFASLEEKERRTATWLLAGSVLALPPVLAVVPSPRLLGASMLGVAAIVALLLDRAWFPAVPEEGRTPAELSGLVALALGFAHLVHAPATSWLMSRKFHKSAAYFASAAASLAPRLADRNVDEVVVLRGIGAVFFLPFAVERYGMPPSTWRILSQTGHALAMRRDARTIDVIVPRDRAVFPSGPGNLFRSEDARLAAGDSFTVPGMHATVLEVGDEGARSVRFEFDRPLESSSIAWIAERLDGFHDESLPERGFGKAFDP